VSKINSDKFTILCIHNNKVDIEMVMDGEYWDSGAHLEVEGCNLCMEYYIQS